MDRSARGFVLLAVLCAAAFLAVALVPNDSPSDTRTVVDGTERLYALPPYMKPAVPDGYEARPVKGLWRLEDVESDSRTLVIRAASGGCWKFDFLSVDSLTTESVRLTAWNEQWVPIRENYGCTLELGLATYRVRLPEPVDGRRIEGECRPGDESPAERQCAALLTAITTR